MIHLLIRCPGADGFIFILSVSSSMEPHIMVTPPGPRAQAVLARDGRVISQSMSRAALLVTDRAEGMNLWDVDGNRYLDFTAGIAVMNAGWNPPAVVDAVRKQAGRLTHGAFLDFCSEPPVRLAERLTGLLPDGLDSVYFSNSGAESIEAALKLARHHTGRKYFLAFYGGFHGRTFGALSLTSSRVIQRQGFGPFLPVIHLPYPDPYRSFGGEDADCVEEVVRHLHDEVFSAEVSPREVAGIFVEPVLGEGGYVVPPPTFLRVLREICDEHGIMMVADEVQSGCMRTGTMLACEHAGVVPDIVCMAKALGGGLPLGATIASHRIMTWPRGAHASTFGGNNLSCAASLATLDILAASGFGDGVLDKGAFLLDRLRGLSGRHPAVGDVRGIGLMAAVELVRDRESKEHAPDLRDAVIREAFENGVTFLPAGRSAIRFSPPLIVSCGEIELGVKVLEDALEACTARGWGA
ncbi:MAG: aminotransferase class III-fold pyridoxal phosphate-dependent enzyme [Methanomicrobiales archaeon]